MATEYMEAPEVRAVANELIEQHHSHLEEARIAYLFRNGPWVAQQRETWGKAQLVTGQQRFLTELDFVITINVEGWNQFARSEREALVDHELMHCCRGDDDRKGNPTWYIQGHDLEEFHAVVQRHGLWRPDIERFKKALDDAQQLSIFDAEVEVEEREDYVHNGAVMEFRPRSSADQRPSGTEG